jgi:hypothetical protein
MRRASCAGRVRVTVASWSQHKRSRLESARCPVHGCLVVRRADTSWIMKCEMCFADAVAAACKLRLWVS